MKNLEDTFTSIVSKYVNAENIGTLWREIEEHYSLPERHYHSLNHLENLLLQLEEVKNQIDDWETVLFCLFYHDIIYDASKSDNEEKSAELAKLRLTGIGFPENKIERCVNHILATKSHQLSADNDTNLFTDADLSILGVDEEIYMQYARNVRKEYATYPDSLYNPGRSKAMKHFLEMENIYKTAFFQEKLEAKARENIAMELDLLARN